MNFTIDQIINLSKQGFSAQQIEAFDKTMPIQPQVQPQAYPQPQVQPQVQPQAYPQAYPQVQPQVYPQVQPQVQPQVYPQVQPQVQPQAYPQVQPQVYQETPFVAPRSGLADTSLQMLDAIRAMQNANLAGASGQGAKPLTAEDVGLNILGNGVKTDGNK